LIALKMQAQQPGFVRGALEIPAWHVRNGSAPEQQAG